MAYTAAQCKKNCPAHNVVDVRKESAHLPATINGVRGWLNVRSVVFMRNWKYAALGVLTAGAISTGLGGSTLAAWSDEGKAGVDAKVSAGFLDLDVSPATSGANTTGWVDLTPEDPGKPVLAPDKGKPINPATYRIVPGATIAYFGKVKVGLDGDNLKAKLIPDYKDESGTTGLWTTNGGTDPKDKGVSADVKLYKWNNSIAESTEEVPASATGTELCSEQVAAATSVAKGTGCNMGVLNKADFAKGASATHLAVIKLTFDKDATSKQNESLTLKGINLKLQQVAPATAA